ncbi:uncharacterized protein LOC131285758 [Anopheles ziemanni]|uniref:uncharacterized protein LOC131268996 n=1 Tax=Anopheles coustani TaxID=139045 RepID=UPI0026596FDF|nr:uncharacterized protein LOC131268996 [Anopheles coustani]XP_058170598.1 uncharacterized protein LOC131285758 [Anopheles ziemanni]
MLANAPFALLLVLFIGHRTDGTYLDRPLWVADKGISYMMQNRNGLVYAPELMPPVDNRWMPPEYYTADESPEAMEEPEVQWREQPAAPEATLDGASQTQEYESVYYGQRQQNGDYGFLPNQPQPDDGFQKLPQTADADQASLWNQPEQSADLYNSYYNERPVEGPQAVQPNEYHQLSQWNEPESQEDFKNPGPSLERSQDGQNADQPNEYLKPSQWNQPEPHVEVQKPGPHNEHRHSESLQASQTNQRFPAVPYLQVSQWNQPEQQVNQRPLGGQQKPVQLERFPELPGNSQKPYPGLRPQDGQQTFLPNQPMYAQRPQEEGQSFQPNRPSVNQWAQPDQQVMSQPPLVGQRPPEGQQAFQPNRPNPGAPEYPRNKPEQEFGNPKPYFNGQRPSEGEQSFLPKDPLGEADGQQKPTQWRQPEKPINNPMVYPGARPEAPKPPQFPQWNQVEVDGQKPYLGPQRPLEGPKPSYQPNQPQAEKQNPTLFQWNQPKPQVDYQKPNLGIRTPDGPSGQVELQKPDGLFKPYQPDFPTYSREQQQYPKPAIPLDQRAPQSPMKPPQQELPRKPQPQPQQQSQLQQQGSPQYQPSFPQAPSWESPYKPDQQRPNQPYYEPDNNDDDDADDQSWEIPVSRVDPRCPRNDDPAKPVHIPSPTSCVKFQKCFNGVAYEMSCPPGLEFDASGNRCDYPAQANCSRH